MYGDLIARPRSYVESIEQYTADMIKYAQRIEYLAKQMSYEGDRGNIRA